MRPKKIPYDFTKKKDIIRALQAGGNEQKRLFARARDVREEVFAKKVEVRSVIEYSNICEQTCNFCGINARSGIKRYILHNENVMKRVERLYNLGRRVIMFQTGETRSNRCFESLYSLLKRVKEKHPNLTMICCLGNLSEEKYKKLKDIGIERYLLKFETSDPKLYRKVKPSDNLKNRLAHIGRLKKLGFQVSSGNILGLPGQSLGSIADDLLFLKKLDIPMVSTSVFIPNDMSRYAACPPGEINMALNFMAILRVMCPETLIPSTSSLELLINDGQYLGLTAGANAITLHDGTPKSEEDQFVIYKKVRYKPRDVLFDTVKKAGLTCSGTSLIRDKIENSLFHKLILKNVSRTGAAVHFENRKYTYGDLLTMTSKFCSFLQKKKIREGDIVLLALFDSVEFIVAFLSCVRLGITVGTVDPQLNKDEWDDILTEIRPFCILTSKSVRDEIGDKRFLGITTNNSSEYFFSILKKQPESKTYVSPDRNNPAVILFTSGTTGTPKGVTHTYGNLFVDTFPRTVLKMSGKDTIFSCSRIHTSFGLGNSLLFPFHSGASVILSRNIPNPFSLEGILKLKPTLFFAVPSMYEVLTGYRDPLKDLFENVRLFIVSGEKLSPSVARKWESAYHKKLLECYGSTEMCHPFISNLPGKEKTGSCGKILKGFGLKFSKSGRILCGGPSLFSGYYGDNELTAKKLANGWFRSDDIGYKNRAGFVFFRGRDNLIVKVGGKWISILDIEDKIKRHGLIREIAVIKKQDGLDYYVSLNKRIASKDAEKDIRRYCKKCLNVHEFPRAIHVLDEIPKTKSKKINRRLLEN